MPFSVWTNRIVHKVLRKPVYFFSVWTVFYVIYFLYDCSDTLFSWCCVVLYTICKNACTHIPLSFNKFVQKKKMVIVYSICVIIFLALWFLYFLALRQIINRLWKKLNSNKTKLLQNAQSKEEHQHIPRSRKKVLGWCRRRILEFAGKVLFLEEMYIYKRPISKEGQSEYKKSKSHKGFSHFLKK